MDAGLSWDDQPSFEIVSLWMQYRSKLSCFSDLNIHRFVIAPKGRTFELHAFSDTSEKGYAVAVYCRSIDPEGRVDVSLLCAKSKVAPLKTVSISRLELCGAQLLSKTMKHLFQSYTFLTVDPIFARSDSTIALSWIKWSPHGWKTFVGNRVSHIREIIPPERWFYVESCNNPADCNTRGLSPKLLLNQDLRWHGPQFLQFPQKEWPALYIEETQEEEKRACLLTSVNTVPNHNIFLKVLRDHAKLEKLQRIIIYCLRFVANLK